MNKYDDDDYLINREDSIEYFNNISKEISSKHLEHEISTNFFKLCPNVPGDILAKIVSETLQNYKKINNLYKK